MAIFQPPDLIQNEHFSEILGWQVNEDSLALSPRQLVKISCEKLFIPPVGLHTLRISA